VDQDTRVSRKKKNETYEGNTRPIILCLRWGKGMSFSDFHVTKGGPWTVAKAAFAALPQTGKKGRWACHEKELGGRGVKKGEALRKVLSGMHGGGKKREASLCARPEGG